MARLDIEGLCFQVGRHRILKDVAFTVEEGRCLALLGPSGCGKTTTLRAIAGFVRPTAGTIRFNGAPVTRLPPHRRNTGLVFQDYALSPHMTVAENVAYGRPRPRSRAVLAFRGASNVIEGTVEGEEDGAAVVRIGERAAIRVAAGASGRVRLGIRPERIAIAHGPANGATGNVLTGRVREAVYKGTYAEVYVDAGAAEPLLVHWRDGPDGALGRLAVGETVHVTIDPGSVILFP